jgi:hypothetical protein
VADPFMKKSKVKNGGITASDFGLIPDYRYECIIAAYDPSGEPHLAPIGVRVLEERSSSAIMLEARIFTSARMFKCLNHWKACTVHFPMHDQLEAFFLAFQEDVPRISDRIIPPGSIVKAETVHAPVWKVMRNYMEARVMSIHEELVKDEISALKQEPVQRRVFTLETTKLVITAAGGSPVNRQTGVLVEFLVEASRLKWLPPGSELHDQKLNRLREMLDTMERVAPGNESNRIASELLELLESMTAGKSR